jgi:hypothetical protein
MNLKSISGHAGLPWHYSEYENRRRTLEVGITDNPNYPSSQFVKVNGETASEARANARLVEMAANHFEEMVRLLEEVDEAFSAHDPDCERATVLGLDATIFAIRDVLRSIKEDDQGAKP